MPTAPKNKPEAVKTGTRRGGGERNIVARVSQVFSVFFYFIWILIGLFVLLFIYANFKQGAFSGLLNPRPPQQQAQVQPPTETALPGIGKVNISCVQSSLSQEVIAKIVEKGDASKLTADEKSKLEPCIIQKEEATPSASP